MPLEAEREERQPERLTKQTSSRAHRLQKLVTVYLLFLFIIVHSFSPFVILCSSGGEMLTYLFRA